MATLSTPCISRFLATPHLKLALGGAAAGERIRVRKSIQYHIPKMCVRSVREQASPRAVEDDLQGYWQHVHICNAARVGLHIPLGSLLCFRV